MLGPPGPAAVSRDGGMEPLKPTASRPSRSASRIDVETPMVWRGPDGAQAPDQLLHQTNWRDVDYLIVDMPPGTGDTQLSLAQKVPVTGAVIVTTPQDIALIDARKGLKMFEKVNIPILGIVENSMASTSAPQCATPNTFSARAVARMCADYGVEFLGACLEIPSVRWPTAANRRWSAPGIERRKSTAPSPAGWRSRSPKRLGHDQ